MIIDEKKLESMRKAYADRKEVWPYVGNLFECMDTLEKLWKAARSAEEYYQFPSSHNRMGLKEALSALKSDGKENMAKKITPI